MQYINSFRFAGGEGVSFPPTVWGEFNGTNSGLTIPVVMDMSQDWTLQFDFYINSASVGNNDRIFIDTTPVKLSGEGVQFKIFDTSNESYTFSVSNAGGNLITESLIDYDTWHRLVVNKIGNNFSYDIDFGNWSDTVEILTYATSTESITYYGRSPVGNYTPCRLANLIVTNNGIGNNYQIIDPSTGLDTSGDGNNGTPTNVIQGT